jgi:hypothetical protein
MRVVLFVVATGLVCSACGGGDGSTGGGAGGSAGSGGIDGSAGTDGTTAPSTPTLTGTQPPSPSNLTRMPLVEGTTDAGASVQLFTSANCGGAAVASGTADRSGAFSLGVMVAADSSTSFYAHASDAVGHVSGCSVGITYVHDDIPPSNPTLTGTTPPAPSHVTSPRVQGSAEANATIRIYTNSTCSGVIAGMANADGSGAFSVSVSVASNTTTTFFATAMDPAGNLSGCAGGLAYVNDSIAPAPPTLTSTVPAPPSNSSTTPQVLGTAEIGATVRLFTNGGCSGSPMSTGTADGSGAFSLAGMATANATTAFFANATDLAGNTSDCSSGLSYTHDNIAPGQPTLTGTTPNSPSNSIINPMINGTAEANATVRLYTTSNCTGTVSATSNASLAGVFSIGVAVSRNTTTTFFAAATDAAGNTGVCSLSLPYTEDDIAPARPSITGSSPQSPSNVSTSPLLAGTAENGATVRIYTTANCTGTLAGMGTAAGTGFTIGVNVTTNTSTTFFAAATDLAGNTSDCSAGFTYIHDSIAPNAPSLASTTPASPSNGTITPMVNGTAEANSTVRLFTDSRCTGTLAGSAVVNGSGNFGITVTAGANTATTFFGNATDSAGNTSGCSSGITYVHDNIRPDPPTVSGTSPASPSDVNNPSVNGSAEAGSTVQLFGNSSCSGAVLGSGTPAGNGSFSIAASVADNTSTTFFANATDGAGNVSLCSTPPVIYNEISPVITGTVSYSGSRSGRIFIAVMQNNGGDTIAGTSIAAPGPYTIRGIPSTGNLNLVAWRDSLDIGTPNGAADPTAIVNIPSYTGGLLANQNITLTDPPAGAPSVPGIRFVGPADQSLLVGWNRGGGGPFEGADHYRVYYDTNSNPGTSSPSQTFLALPLNAGVVQGLTNGTPYYVAISAIAGAAESPLSPPSGPVTVGARTGGSGATGTIVTSGIVPNGTMYAILFNQSSGPSIQRITAPSSMQSWSIQGAPIALDDTYYTLAALDLNNDGQFGVREPFSFGSGSPTTFVQLIGASTPAPAVQLFGSAGLFQVQTDHFLNGSESYDVALVVTSNTKLAVNAVLTSGPHATPPIDLGMGFNNGPGVRLTTRLSLGSTPPAVGDSYSIDVAFDDNSTATLNASVTGVIGLPTSLAPTMGGASPTFTWSPPAVTPSTYHYSFDIRNSTCCSDLWQYDPMPSTRTSLLFNFDGLTSGPLVAGSAYQFGVSLTDDKGNRGSTAAIYQAQ